jgi:hypothetical protein
VCHEAAFVSEQQFLMDGSFAGLPLQHVCPSNPSWGKENAKPLRHLPWGQSQYDAETAKHRLTTEFLRISSIPNDDNDGQCDSHGQQQVKVVMQGRALDNLRKACEAAGYCTENTDSGAISHRLSAAANLLWAGPLPIATCMEQLGFQHTQHWKTLLHTRTSKDFEHLARRQQTDLRRLFCDQVKAAGQTAEAMGAAPNDVKGVWNLYVAMRHKHGNGRLLLRDATIEISQRKCHNCCFAE